jgi:hypothetical protein
MKEQLDKESEKSTGNLISYANTWTGYHKFCAKILNLLDLLFECFVFCVKSTPNDEFIALGGRNHNF